MPDCPCCKSFADGRDSSNWHKVTVFTLRGVTHAVPSMWLAGRLLGDKEEMVAAVEAWAWHCGVEIERESYRSAAA